MKNHVNLPTLQNVPKFLTFRNVAFYTTDPCLSFDNTHTCGGFFSGERFKKHEIDHQFGGHFCIFYCACGHLNGHFWVFFKHSPLKNPPLDNLNI